MFTVPVTRGSRMKFLPVCWPTALITDWMSALTKLTVIFSSSAAAGMHSDSAAAASRPRGSERHRLRNVVTYLVFSIDLSGILRQKRGQVQRKRGQVHFSFS